MEVVTHCFNEVLYPMSLEQCETIRNDSDALCGIKKKQLINTYTVYIITPFTCLVPQKDTQSPMFLSHGFLKLILYFNNYIFYDCAHDETSIYFNFSSGHTSKDKC